MGRLTPKDWENQSNEIWLKLGYMHMSDEPFRTFLSESLQKLAHYEDLEEAGRLIELPCAVGDTVYWISEPDACFFCVGECYERCEEGALKIKEIPFKPHMLNEIGEIIFLTKEEAEKAGGKA